jgi:hypothetical protein
MLPLIIMAAASILSNQKKQEEARRQNYLSAMERQAQQLGGHTDLADVYRQGRAIDQSSADYGPLLSLVGAAADGGGYEKTDQDPELIDGGHGAFAQGGVVYNPERTVGGPNDDEDLLKKLKIY